MPVVDDDLSALLRRVARLSAAMERQEQGGIGASASQLFAMEELTESPLTQSELAARLGLEKSTVSRLVSGLEARGWVSRHRHLHNRRFSLVTLSAAGLAAAESAAVHLRQRHAELVAALSEEERSALAIGVGALTRLLGEG
ncbi:MAG: MarR family winged helix-turn-helix transcriptional regulator [Propionibacteriaceae bacterium]